MEFAIKIISILVYYYTYILLEVGLLEDSEHIVIKAHRLDWLNTFSIRNRCNMYLFFNFSVFNVYFRIRQFVLKVHFQFHEFSTTNTGRNNHYESSIITAMSSLTIHTMFRKIIE